MRIFVGLVSVLVCQLSAAQLLSSDIKTASDSDLRAVAERELRASRVEVFASAGSSLNDVSVPQLLAVAPSPKLWRAGLNFQSFAFDGSIRSRTGESFALNGLESGPMLGLDVCRNIGRLSRFEFATCLDLQFAQKSIHLKTSSEMLIPDVSLKSFLADLHLEAGLKPIPKWPWYLTTSAGLGSHLFLYNSDSNLADGSEAAGFYELSAGTRIDFWKTLYSEIAYEFRGLFAESSEQKLQAHNLKFGLGFIF